MKRKLEKDAMERCDELVNEITNEDELKGLKESMDWSNSVARIYLDNPDFLINMAKIRGMYYKALRKNGFSKKTAEIMVFSHFDDYSSDNFEPETYDN
ncbi:hypothetical protein D4R42_04000 [bacterium]|nr:MAG: hypothetical protein D4R42_04000 [bacterium]